MTNTSQGPDKKNDNESLKEKLKQRVESFKKNEKVEDIYNYASANTRDTIAYILMVVGLILMLVEPSWYGATLVGVIFGLYFFEEILSFLKYYKVFMTVEGMVRSLILGGLILALFISAPFIFLGAAVAVGLRVFINSENNPSKRM